MKMNDRNIMMALNPSRVNAKKIKNKLNLLTKLWWTTP